MRTAHKDNLKRVTLELGGKSANIVMDDADIDLAVALSDFALFSNSGQSCMAGSRLFVHEKIYDEIIVKAANFAQSKKLGDQFDFTTQQGP